MIRDLVLKNRSYRRFFQQIELPYQQLLQLIDLARCSASARNAQPLKYILSTTPAHNQLIFPHLRWAGYLTDWDGPAQGERPAAYVIMLADKNIADNYYCDHGIAAQSILLGATELGYGGCIVAAIDRKAIQTLYKIPDNLEIIQVIALGKPKEEVLLEPMNDSADYKYWRDENGRHHVPKRSLNEIIMNYKPDN